MKPNFLIKAFSLLCCMMSVAYALNAQTTLTGVILDEDSKERIIGASILVKGTSEGTVTDMDGSFTLSTSKVAPFVLVVSYTGYSPQEMTISEGQSEITILMTSGSMLDEIVISASRKPEKVQDAPASVSIITAERIENMVVPNPISLLENTVGVNIDKQGASRTNITMRGGADLLTTSTFVLMDYRSLIGSGLNSFDAGATTLMTIDIDRVEAIRGPGSALYGPGVTSGVVHFFTKDPFKYPGTTVEMVAGNQNTLRPSVRHAGHNAAKTFGYKITALYSQADEWGLDPEDETDAAVLATFQDEVIDPVDGSVVNKTGGQLDESVFGYSAAASLYFRPQADLEIVTSGGYQYGEGLYWSSQGEGYVAAADVFTQARVSYKGLFAQVYYNANTAPEDVSEKGFLYRTGQLSLVDRKQFETQLQYNFDVKPLRTNITVGGDYRTSALESETRTFGRFEDDDDYDVYGGYAQTKTALSDQFDMVLAARYDGFSAIDQTAFSPRVALVYKASPNHTLRASYNKAFAPNSALDLYADLPIGNFTAFDLWLNGNANVQTFNDPTTTFLIPGLGENAGVGMNVGTGYGFITSVIGQQIAGGNPDLVALAPLLPILSDPNFIAAINGAGAFSAGIPIDVDGNLLPLQGTPVSTLREEVNLEIGYKGIINDKLAVNIDIYQINRKNFSGLRQISPLVILPTLGEDINAVLVPTLAATLIGLGTDPAVAQATAEATAAAYLGTTNSITMPGGVPGPLGVVETDQVPEGGLPHVAYGYRNFGDVTYYGVDFGLNYFATDVLRLFGNYSWVSDNSFTGDELGESASPTDRSDLNFAQHRIRTGANYEPSGGIQAGLSVMHNSEFTSTLGFYSGTVDARTLVDANLGYKFDNGLFASVSVDNVFNNEYRTYPNMPKIGTRVLGTIRYTFGQNK